MTKYALVLLLALLAVIGSHFQGSGQTIPPPGAYLPYIAVSLPTEMTTPASTPTTTPMATETPVPTSTPTNTPTRVAIDFTSTPMATMTSTLVPAETSTRLPEPTQTPTVTPVTGKVVSIGKISTIGGVHGPTYVGEVQNQTGGKVGLVRVTITGYDGDGKIVFSEGSYTKKVNIGPWEKACFSVYTFNGNAVPIRLNVVTGWSASVENRVDLSPVNFELAVDDLGNLQALGEIWNDSEFTATSPVAVITMYDFLGNAIACDANAGVIQVLEPGKSTPAKVLISRYNSVAVGYVVHAEGWSASR